MILKKIETPRKEVKIKIGGSKSESNRLLVLNALYKNTIEISNLSDAEDTFLLHNALAKRDATIDIHHAGTAMRFLTAFLSIQEGETFVITGSDRMKQRPIGVLVDALRELGAEITYLEKEGFPPLKIIGKKILGGELVIDGSVSSQYLTALILIGSKLKHGLRLIPKGKITSLPYLKMTLAIQKSLGIVSKIENETISVPFVPIIEKQNFTVESDWSSASYFYSIVAIANDMKLELSSYKTDSLQGDRRVAEIYKEFFGVETEFLDNTIILRKNPNFKFNHSEIVKLNLNDCPDIAQTICVTATALKIPISISGLETLKIKETDRLIALKIELEKCGAKVEISDSTIEIFSYTDVKSVTIKTYNDHRMAMAFAPLALKMDLEIENPEVVEKSYPNFWKDVSKIEN